MSVINGGGSAYPIETTATKINEAMVKEILDNESVRPEYKIKKWNGK